MPYYQDEPQIDENTPMDLAQFNNLLRRDGASQEQIDLFKHRLETGEDFSGYPPEGPSAMIDAPGEPLWEWHDEWILRMCQ